MMRAALFAGLLVVGLTGCASASNDDVTEDTSDEAALSTAARAYVGEYVQLAFGASSGPGLSLQLATTGKYVRIEGGNTERGRFMVVHGRKPIHSNIDNGTPPTDVEDDVLRLTSSSGQVTELFVGPTYLRDAILVSSSSSAQGGVILKRLHASRCTATTCANEYRASCVDVTGASGKVRGVCLDNAHWSIGAI